MPRRPVVAVVGSDDPQSAAHARELGRLIAEQGWVVVCGGRDSGVMRAVSEGARAAGGLTIGILPNAESEVAPGVEVAVVTDLGNARNNVIVLTGQVVVACGVNGAGTASEVSLALKNRKPVVLLGASEAAGTFFEELAPSRVFFADNPAEAIAVILEKGFCRSR